MIINKKQWPRLLLVTILLMAVLFCLAYPKKMSATMVADSESGTKVLVLNYHKVDNTFISLAVRPDDFDKQMQYLSDNGYNTITPDELYDSLAGNKELPENPVLITFDDGYEDNYTTMLPIIEKYNMKAVVYMVTNDIGKSGYLTWDELRDMQERGVEIGSHTANHQPLTKLERDKQIEEMHLSKLLMEWNGIKTVFSFSYPNGAYDENMPMLLQENEYLTAVTGDAGLNTMTTNPYLLQRLNIPRPRFGLLEFKLRLFKAELFTRLNIKQHQE